MTNTLLFLGGVLCGAVAVVAIGACLCAGIGAIEEAELRDDAL